MIALRSPVTFGTSTLLCSEVGPFCVIGVLGRGAALLFGGTFTEIPTFSNMPGMPKQKMDVLVAIAQQKMLLRPRDLVEKNTPGEYL